jgi:hypothetical protein
MIPIDRQVQQTMGAFRGQPDKLMQRYKQGNDLIDLLALQQMKSDMDAVKQQMVLSQQQMPGTIKDQREQEVLAGYKEKAGRQVGDVAKNTAGLLNQRQASVNANMQRQGITQQPAKTASNGGLMQMAGGGIVGYKTGKTIYAGGVTQADVDRFKLTGGAAGSFVGLTDTQIAQIIAKAKGKNVQPDVTVAQAMNKKSGQTLSTQAPSVAQPQVTSPTEVVPVEQTDYVKEKVGTVASALNKPAAEVTADDIAKNAKTLGYKQEKSLVEDPPDPDADKSGGLGSLTPSVPTKENFDAAAVQTKINPILEKYGLADVGSKTFTGVRDADRAESDRYLDRAGVKQIRQGQLDELENLKQKQLDPETLKRDNLLRGLIAASGGGNFAAVGQGIFNAEDAQAVQERNFLKEKFGIQDNLLDTDLEIAMKGIDSGNQAIKILGDQQQAAAKIVSDFSVEEMKDMRERSKQKFESGQNAIANRLKEREINALEEYRKAVTDNQKLQVLIDQTGEISTVMSTAIEMDAQLVALRAEIEDDPDDQSLKDEYQILLKQKQIEVFDMINMSGLFDLVDQIKVDLGYAAGSTGADGFGSITKTN